MDASDIAWILKYKETLLLTEMAVTVYFEDQTFQDVRINNTYWKWIEEDYVCCCRLGIKNSVKVGVD